MDFYLVADVSNDPDDEGITIIFIVGNYCQSPPRDIAEVLNIQLSDGAYPNLSTDTNYDLSEMQLMA